MCLGVQLNIFMQHLCIHAQPDRACSCCLHGHKEITSCCQETLLQKDVELVTFLVATFAGLPARILTMHIAIAAAN